MLAAANQRQAPSNGALASNIVLDTASTTPANDNTPLLAATTTTATSTAQ
jgi:hypothetical protein